MISLASLMFVGSVRLSVYQENLSATPYTDHEIILKIIYLFPQTTTMYRKQALILPMHLCLTALLLEYSLYFPSGALQSTLPAGTELLTLLCSLPASMSSHGMWWQETEAVSCHRQQKELRHWHSFTQHPLGELSCTVLGLFLLLLTQWSNAYVLFSPRKMHATVCVGWSKCFCNPCSDSSPWPDTVMNSALLLLVVLCGLDLTLFLFHWGGLAWAQEQKKIPKSGKWKREDLNEVLLILLPALDWRQKSMQSRDFAWTSCWELQSGVTTFHKREQEIAVFRSTCCLCSYVQLLC